MGSMLEIRKDTVRQVERSSLLGEPVVAIPIEVDENEKQTDAAHELHRLSQTPQVVFLLHVFSGKGIFRQKIRASNCGYVIFRHAGASSLSGNRAVCTALAFVYS